MSQQDRPTFWIEKFNGVNPPRYICHTIKPDILSLIKIRINDGDPIAASEYFEVIPKSEVRELLREYEAMLDTFLTMFGDDNENYSAYESVLTTFRAKHGDL